MNNGEAYTHNRCHEFFLIFKEGNEVTSDVIGQNGGNEMKGLYHIKVRLVWSIDGPVIDGIFLQNVVFITVRKFFVFLDSHCK
jgi:hypothetical protein